MSIEARIREASPQNTTLLNTLHETRNAITDLETQNSYIYDLENQVRDANAKLKKLEDTRKREMKEHESLRDSKVSKRPRGTSRGHLQAD